MPLLAVFYLLLLAALLALLLRLKRPTNDRPWQPEMARPAHAVFSDANSSKTGDKSRDETHDQVTLHNVRDIHYGPPGTPFEVVWETRSYDLDKVQRVWFAVESFSKLEVIAHTLLSFEFAGGDYLAFSAEARLIRGESYDILRGLLNNFELMYTFGSERDFLLRRTTYKDHDVYLYPLTLTPAEAQVMLRDILQTANALRERPRFYNSVAANCTGLLGVHANRARPGSFAWWQPAQVLPGISDRLLRRKGWIDTEINTEIDAKIDARLPFEQLREVYNIRARAQQCGDDPAVSERLREGFMAETASSDGSPL